MTTTGLYRTIVVGTDGSPTACGAVTHACELARLTGAQLHVVSARRADVALVGAPELGDGGLGEAAKLAHDATAAVLDEARDTVIADTGIEPQLHAPIGAPASCLIEVARTVDADLIVVGSRGMHGARRLIGSIPNSVAHHAACHVLVVHTC
jgi:nucleotide-binding universal stress UspA family protein